MCWIRQPEQLLAVSEVFCKFFVTLILGFPVIFSLGLLPQISTFAVHILEKLDIHVFGGTAVTGLSSVQLFSSFFFLVSSYLFFSVRRFLASKRQPAHSIFSFRHTAVFWLPLAISYCCPSSFRCNCLSLGGHLGIWRPLQPGIYSPS